MVSHAHRHAVAVATLNFIPPIVKIPATESVHITELLADPKIVTEVVRLLNEMIWVTESKLQALGFVRNATTENVWLMEPEEATGTDTIPEPGTFDAGSSVDFGGVAGNKYDGATHWTNDFWLDDVTVKINPFDDATGENYNLKVYANPTGTNWDLKCTADETVAGSSLTPSSWNSRTFNFTGGNRPRLTKNIDYAIVIHRSGTENATFTNISRVNSDTQAGTTWISANPEGSGTWSTNSSREARFVVNFTEITSEASVFAFLGFVKVVSESATWITEAIGKTPGFVKNILENQWVNELTPYLRGLLKVFGDNVWVLTSPQSSLFVVKAVAETIWTNEIQNRTLALGRIINETQWILDQVLNQPGIVKWVNENQWLTENVFDPTQAFVRVINENLHITENIIDPLLSFVRVINESIHSLEGRFTVRPYVITEAIHIIEPLTSLNRIIPIIRKSINEGVEAIEESIVDKIKFGKNVITKKVKTYKRQIRGRSRGEEP